MAVLRFGKGFVSNSTFQPGGCFFKCAKDTVPYPAAAAVVVPALLLSQWYVTASDDATEPTVPTVCYALVAFAPLALAPSLLPAWQRYDRKGLWAVQLLLLLAPLVAAVWLLVAKLGPLDYYEGAADGIAIVMSWLC